MKETGTDKDFGLPTPNDGRESDIQRAVRLAGEARDYSDSLPLSEKEKQENIRLQKIRENSNMYDSNFERMKARHGMMRSTLRDRHCNS